MNIPIKQHQLTSHFVPGLIVLMLLIFSHYNWDYIRFTNVFANQGAIASMSILLFAIAAFLIGEFIDTIRDLFEWLWDLIPCYKVNWDNLFLDTRKMILKREAYWTYYVLCCNIVFSMLVCLILFRFNLISLPETVPISRTYWIVAFWVVAVVLQLDAVLLRIEIIKFTKEKPAEDATNEN